MVTSGSLDRYGQPLKPAKGCRVPGVRCLLLHYRSDHPRGWRPATLASLITPPAVHCDNPRSPAATPSVFITNGPYCAIGSPSGCPAISNSRVGPAVSITTPSAFSSWPGWPCAAGRKHHPASPHPGTHKQMRYDWQTTAARQPAGRWISRYNGAVTSRCMAPVTPWLSPASTRTIAPSGVVKFRNHIIRKIAVPSRESSCPWREDYRAELETFHQSIATCSTGISLWITPRPAVILACRHFATALRCRRCRGGACGPQSCR